MSQYDRQLVSQIAGNTIRTRAPPCGETETLQNEFHCVAGFYFACLNRTLLFAPRFEEKKYLQYNLVQNSWRLH